MLAILVGCGLRRAELANLPIEKIQVRQGHWVIVDLVGKGGHVRTIPIPRPSVPCHTQEWKRSGVIASTGSVRREGNRLRITAELSKADDGFQPSLCTAVLAPAP